MAPGNVGLSLLITIGILVVLGIFAGVQQRPEPSDGVAVANQLGSGRDGAAMAIPTEGYANPLEPAPKAEWEVLTNCELVRNPMNAAYRFRVKRDEKPMVFQLYFVEAPELTDPGEDEVSDQARYFSWPQKWGPEECADRSIALGQQAWQAVESMLGQRPFMVLTKFDLRRETHYFYGLVVIEDAQGRRRTLQEWLVENGYASIVRPALGWLPLQVSTEEFVERLERLQSEAQRERRGGWGLPSAAP